MTERADLLVVGLGAMGSAVAYHGTQQGLAVIGLDRYEPPHEMGSSHAETRITRLAVGEGPQYLPFVARAHELWRHLEERTGETILHPSGGYIVTDPVLRGSRWPDFVTTTDDIARRAGIDFDVITPAEVRSAQPLLRLPDEVRVGFEPSAGVVMAERAVRIQLELARRSGAQVHTNERVIRIEPGRHHVEVTTTSQTYLASQVVLAAGPWTPELAHPAHGGQLTVTRQVVYWFEADDLDRFSTERFPFVMWVGETDEDYVAFFPRPPDGLRGLKTLGEQFVEETTADDVDRTVSDDEIRRFYEEKLVPKLDGVSPRCIKAEVCLYTNTPDDHFLIDRDPRSDRVLVMSPCSGHGFKHSAALGEAVARLLATGTSALDLTPFCTRDVL